MNSSKLETLLEKPFPRGSNAETIIAETGDAMESRLATLRRLLDTFTLPFEAGIPVGIKIHWGERGNRSFLSPHYTREICHFLTEKGFNPFVFDTTVLYSGGRRTAEAALETAALNGFSEESIGCPIVIADGADGRDVIDIPAGERHFRSVQVASLTAEPIGFVIFSHFKGHLAAGFGGALKNISMGFASRAQKQRMHADVVPTLHRNKCSQCGLCIEVCPAGAVAFSHDGFPFFDHRRCIGCAQCIALCPETALKILWGSEASVFKEKLIETASAVWKNIHARTILINALLTITSDCDCMAGNHPIIAPDFGFIGGAHPVSIDRESLRVIGESVFSRCHPSAPWPHQFDYAEQIGFV